MFLLLLWSVHFAYVLVFIWVDARRLNIAHILLRILALWQSTKGLYLEINARHDDFLLREIIYNRLRECFIVRQRVYLCINIWYVREIYCLYFGVYKP